MCKSQADGGARCYPHGKKAYEGARARLAGLPDNASNQRVAKAENAYEKAVDRFAENPKGHHDLTARLNDLKAGAPADGDNAVIIEVALSDHAPVRKIPRPRSPLTGNGLVGRTPVPQPAPEAEFAVDLAESLRTGKPLGDTAPASGTKPGTTGETALARALRTGELGLSDDTPRAPRTRQESETPLAAALRTGEQANSSYFGVELVHSGDSTVGNERPDAPITIGGITVARGQAPFLQRWGNDPVAVSTKMHVQHFKGDGWSEYDLASESYKPVTDSGATPREGGLFARDTGVLVVQNARTGEKAALRARRNTATGHWQISEDITT